MSFKKILKRIKRPDVIYTLQKKQTYIEEEKIELVKDPIGNTIKKTKKILKNDKGEIIEKDDIGNNPEQYLDIQELDGVIQHYQREEISEAGEESKVRYKGYFMPTFSIDTNCLSDYRIKAQDKNEIVYFKISFYDPNNYLRKNHHHIEVSLKEDRKYIGREKTVVK